MNTLSSRVLHQIGYKTTDLESINTKITEVMLCSELFDTIDIDGEVITQVLESGDLVFNLNRWHGEDEEGYTNVIIVRCDDMDSMIEFECE
ncbi:hypothetical protein [Bacillus toyonensis]